MSNVRSMAIRDWGRFSQSSFDLDLAFTSPDGSQTATAKGIGTNRTIIMITDGQDAYTKRVHIAISEAAILANNASYPTRDVNDYVDLINHRVSFQDARGTTINYRVTDHQPDDTVGMIMCDCEYLT